MQNYELILNEKIDDIDSNAFLFEHKSGAKVIFIENDDTNRVFSACFKTLPEDNTGLPHIMEHCVLCGSQKFRIKDPFNELDKGSINTYLNAMTFCDKTLYPIASTNEKDFYNLMNVYLDSVFFPLIYEREGVFLQEGWHYGKDGINGVVYNEMLGVFSEPEEKLDFKMRESLFQDNCYKYESGGIPESIPELSYQKFLDFHKKYYHPANCILYIYGKLDMEKCLEFIDLNYLSKFEYKKIETKYIEQKPFDKPKEVTVTYDEDDSSIAMMIKSVKATEYEKVMGLSILCDVLFNGQASPIKKLLIDEKICSNVEAYVDEDLYECVISIKCSGSQEKDLNRFKEIIQKGFNDVAQNGIDEKLLTGCILNEEFYIKEQDFGYKPKGLFYNIKILQGFLYGREDFENIKFSQIFEKIKSFDYIKLLKEELIQNKCVCYGILKNGILEKKTDNKVYKNNESKLKEYQNIIDSNDEIEKIPSIKIDEISKDAFKLNTECINDYITFDEIKSEISYITLLVDTAFVPIELKQYVAIFRYLIGRMNTKNYKYEDLNNDINYYFGGFEVYFSSYYLGDNYLKNTDFMTSINFNIRALNQNILKGFKYIYEVLFETDFSDLNRIENCLKDFKSRIEDGFYQNGNTIATLRCLSYFNDLNRYNENLRGIAFYDFLCKIISEKRFEEVKIKLEELKKFLIQKRAIKINICSNNQLKNPIVTEFKALFQKFSDDEIGKRENLFEYQNKNEGFILGGDVNYNVLASNYFDTGFEFSGKLQVLNKIISSDYLWNKVRGENGAYGSDLSIRRNGMLFFSSFRDPSVENTYKLYEQVYNYLLNLKLSDSDIKKYIIGTINILDRPIKNNEIAEISLFRYFSGLKYEKIKNEREEILSFSKVDIQDNIEIFNRILNNPYYCSIGCSNQIKAGQGRFNLTRKLK